MKICKISRSGEHHGANWKQPTATFCVHAILYIVNVWYCMNIPEALQYRKWLQPCMESNVVV